ncbi:MAG: element excision factor XisI family protein [Microcystaceae cyanobacterium]
MDKIEQYRKLIQDLLKDYSQDDESEDNIEVQLIFDTIRDHYQWMNVGWEDLNKVYRCIIHIDIKNDLL